MDGWTYDPLWQKAKLFVDRALNEDRDGPLFPFWATLALELLARAALAKVHPALLAEPDCVVAAFGYDIGNKPLRSVMAKTVFLRCQKVVSGFAEEELKACMTMIDRRNEELHTGTLSFDALPTGLWLSEYFRICKLLLSSQMRSLVDFLGAQEAEAAEKMIVAAERDVLARVKKAIAEKKAEFETLGPPDQARMREASTLAIAESSEPSKKIASCPACAASALIPGEQ